MSKPVVLHVAAFANPAGGSFISALAQLGREERFETALLCPRASARFPWTRRLNDAGVHVLHASTPFEVATAVARLAPDVMHAHFMQWMLPATLGAKAAGSRVFWHLHSGVTPNARRVEFVRRLKYASAKHLVERFFCVSPDIVAYLERYGVPSSRIVELPNGVDIEHFRPPTLRERAAMRQRYQLGQREPVIAFFGRESHVKGADRLASALARVSAPPAIIAIAASRATLEALSCLRVIDAGSLVDVREALWASDALALPSRSEGVPYSLLEARACGLPAVASPLPGVLRALGTDAGTHIVDADDAVAFASALEDAAAHGTVPLSARSAQDISLRSWTRSLAAFYTSEEAA